MFDWKYITAMFIGMFLCVTLVYTGCQATKIDKQPEGGTILVNQTEEGLKKDSKTLGTTTAAIKKDVTEGKKVTDTKGTPDLRTAVDPYWLDIMMQAGIQDGLVVELANKSEQLGTAKGQIEELKKHDSQETIRANDAEEKLKDANQKIFRLMMLIGGIGVAISVGLCYSGFKWGVAIGLSSAALTVIGIFLSATFNIIVFVVGGIVIAAIVVAILAFLKHRKDNAQKTEENKKLELAGRQLVETVEQTKQLMTMAGRRKLFGDGAIHGIIHTTQDADTKKMVKLWRQDISKAPELKAAPTIDFDDRPMTEEEIEEAEAQKVRRRRTLRREPDIWAN